VSHPSEPQPGATPPDAKEQTAVLDDWRWHVEGEFPSGQVPEQGYVHIGVFVAWAIGRGLLDAGWAARAGLVSQVIAIAERAAEPCALREATDGRLAKEMLSEEGAAFAAAYYAPEYGYASDWRHLFGREADRYDVPCDWATFDRFAPVVDGRYASWKKAGRPELMPLPGLLGILLRLVSSGRR
jgi:hypothetical protein